MKMRLLTGACLLVLAACSPKQDAPPTATSPEAAGEHVLDCALPAGPGTTAREFLAQYGERAVAGEFPGPEGTTFRGVTLNGDSKTDKLEINWWDKDQTHLSMMRAGAQGSAWRGPSGLHVGSTLAEVEVANGKPFKISGFGWDYGGNVTDFDGGKLDGLPGDCHLNLHFDNPDLNAAMPDGISGDGVIISSDDARVRAYAPVVSEMSVGWALPAGVEPE